MSNVDDKASRLNQYQSNLEDCQAQKLANKLVRRDIKDMVPYQSARREQSQGKVWLNANEAGDSRTTTLSLDALNRYPDFQPQALIDAYSDYCDIDNRYLLATRGADEGIEVLIRTFCQSAQDSILICPPTYGMYAISAEAHNTRVIHAPLLTDNMQLDINAIQQHVGKVKLVFICSPNNPTGNNIDLVDIVTTLELYKDSALVVVDEAYIEYCPEKTLVPLLHKYANLVILRTLSKAFALAGLRCGFTLANPSIIDQLCKVIAPYPISQPVAMIASQALTQRSDMQNRVASTKQLRDKTQDFLQQQPWLVQLFESNSNYLLFRVDNSQALFASLLEQGVVIRNQSKQLGLDDCLRVSIGCEAELQQFFIAVLSFNEQFYGTSTANLFNKETQE